MHETVRASWKWGVSNSAVQRKSQELLTVCRSRGGGSTTAAAAGKAEYAVRRLTGKSCASRVRITSSAIVEVGSASARACPCSSPWPCLPVPVFVATMLVDRKDGHIRKVCGRALGTRAAGHTAGHTAAGHTTKSVRRRARRAARRSHRHAGRALGTREALRERKCRRSGDACLMRQCSRS